MSKTAEDFEREANAIIDKHVASFKVWADAYLADMEIFTKELEASDISESFKIAIGQMMLRKADKLIV